MRNPLFRCAEPGSLFAAGDVFFQRCEIRGLTIELDYWPRRVDVASLRAGNLVELLNLAPLKEVELSLPSVRVNGLQGWPVLATTVAESWLRHIISSQVWLPFSCRLFTERDMPACSMVGLPRLATRASSSGACPHVDCSGAV